MDQQEKYSSCQSPFSILVPATRSGRVQPVIAPASSTGSAAAFRAPRRSRRLSRFRSAGVTKRPSRGSTGLSSHCGATPAICRGRRRRRQPIVGHQQVDLLGPRVSEKRQGRGEGPDVIAAGVQDELERPAYTFAVFYQDCTRAGGNWRIGSGHTVTWEKGSGPFHEPADRRGLYADIRRGPRSAAMDEEKRHRAFGEHPLRRAAEQLLDRSRARPKAPIDDIVGPGPVAGPRG